MHMGAFVDERFMLHGCREEFVVCGVRLLRRGEGGVRRKADNMR